MTVTGYQGNLGVTTIPSHVSPVQAFGMELVLCFVMTLTFITNPRNSLPTTAVLLAANLVAVSKNLSIYDNIWELSHTVTSLYPVKKIQSGQREWEFDIY